MKKLSLKTKKVKVIPFNKLSPSQKRIAIAKDVLQQLKTKKYTAQNSAYIKDVKMLDGATITDYDDSRFWDIQEKFEKIKNCKVCALGACLMSATKFVNKLKFNNVLSVFELKRSENVKSIFTEIFSSEQILLIETAFESDNGDMKYGKEALHKNIDTEDIHKCNKFYSKYKKDESRMIAIMKNIITNNGIFKP